MCSYMCQILLGYNPKIKTNAYVKNMRMSFSKSIKKDKTLEFEVVLRFPMLTRLTETQD